MRMVKQGRLNLTILTWPDKPSVCILFDNFQDLGSIAKNYPHCYCSYLIN